MANFVNGLPRGNPSYMLEFDYRQYVNAAINNPFVLQGSAPVFPGPESLGLNQRMIVFLKTYLASNTGAIQSIDGTVISGTIPANTALSWEPALRVDGGLKLTGNIILATGFYVITSRDLGV